MDYTTNIWFVIGQYLNNYGTPIVTFITAVLLYKTLSSTNKSIRLIEEQNNINNVNITNSLLFPKLQTVEVKLNEIYNDFQFIQYTAAHVSLKNNGKLTGFDAIEEYFNDVSALYKQINNITNNDLNNKQILSNFNFDNLITLIANYDILIEEFEYLLSQLIADESYKSMIAKKIIIYHENTFQAAFDIVNKRLLELNSQLSNLNQIIQRHTKINMFLHVYSVHSKRFQNIRDYLRE